MNKKNSEIPAKEQTNNKQLLDKVEQNIVIF